MEKRSFTDRDWEEPCVAVLSAINWNVQFVAESYFCQLSKVWWPRGAIVKFENKN